MELVRATGRPSRRLLVTCRSTTRRWATGSRPTTLSDYVARRTAEGLSKREIIRCLKRYLAREIYHLLPEPATTAGLHNELKNVAQSSEDR